MIEQIQVAKIFGVAHIDTLLQEMLLGGSYSFITKHTIFIRKKNLYLDFVSLIAADNSSPMSPPMVGNYSPANNNLCDQNVSSTLDGLSQDLQQAPMSPMSPMSASQPQSVLPPTAQQTSQNQLNDINMDPIGVTLQSNIIDPYRRSGKHSMQRRATNSWRKYLKTNP